MVGPWLASGWWPALTGSVCPDFPNVAVTLSCDNTKLCKLCSKIWDSYTILLFCYLSQVLSKLSIFFNAFYLIFRFFMYFLAQILLPRNPDCLRESTFIQSESTWQRWLYEILRNIGKIQLWKSWHVNHNKSYISHCSLLYQGSESWVNILVISSLHCTALHCSGTVQWHRDAAYIISFNYLKNTFILMTTFLMHNQQDYNSKKKLILTVNKTKILW